MRSSNFFLDDPLAAVKQNGCAAYEASNFVLGDPLEAAKQNNVANVAEKKVAKAARRKAAKACKKAAKVPSTTGTKVCRLTGCVAESSHDLGWMLDDEDDEEDSYYAWQAQEIMYLRRQRRVFHAWRYGTYPSWTGPI